MQWDIERWETFEIGGPAEASAGHAPRSPRLARLHMGPRTKRSAPPLVSSSLLCLIHNKTQPVPHPLLCFSDPTGERARTHTLLAPLRLAGRGHGSVSPLPTANRHGSLENFGALFMVLFLSFLQTWKLQRRHPTSVLQPAPAGAGDDNKQMLQPAPERATTGEKKSLSPDTQSWGGYPWKLQPAPEKLQPLWEKLQRVKQKASTACRRRRAARGCFNHLRKSC